MHHSNKLSLAELLLNSGSDDETVSDASARLLAMLNASPDAFIIIDHKGNIELANTTAETMFGYTQQELLGQSIGMLMPEPIKKAHREYLRAYLESGKSSIIGKGRKLYAVKANAEVFPIFLSVGEIKNASHVQFVGVISDISEQVKYETALAETQEKLAQATRLSAMGELAAGIAHEINQPLSAISSYAQASKRMINADGVEHKALISQTLDKICDQALRANEVINRLRNLVQRHTAQREKVNLCDLISQTVDLAKVDIRMQDHEILVEPAQPSEIEFFADPIQIQQVLLNLIRNAVDAMQDLKGTPIHIICRWLSTTEIEVSVVDSGKGIDDDASVNIFVPFFTTKQSGMGMGLPVCQTIIHGHGGRIYYSAREPTGTVFSFSLPVLSDHDIATEK